MNRLHFFDLLQEIVYVTDIETYKLVYLNYATAKYIGVHSPNDVIGKKCYEVFYGADKPCPFCTTKMLSEGDFYEWQHKNETLNTTFLLHDTLFSNNGRQYRLEIGADLDKIQNDTLYQIQNYKNHEKILNEGLAIALHEEDINIGIQKFLEYLGQMSFAQRCYIFENRGRKVDNTYEWCAEGVSCEKDNLQDVPVEAVSVWYDAFRRSRNIIIYNLEDIKDKEKDLYNILKPQNIKTLIVYPIEINQKLVGFYGVDNVPPKIMKDVSDFLSIVSQFFAILLQNRNLISHLKQLGYYDALTELLNRPTAEQKINASLQDNPGAFLLFDLDRFKSVNDLFGHQQGDTLLKNIAHDIKIVCRGADIVFRLGGDEFGIFFPCMTNRQDISNKCKQLINIIGRDVIVGDKETHVGCSIGIAVSDKEATNFATLYTKADMAMYQAKEEKEQKYIFFNDIRHLHHDKSHMH